MVEGFIGKVKASYAKGIGNEKYKEAIAEMIYDQDKTVEIRDQERTVARDGR